MSQQCKKEEAENPGVLLGGSIAELGMAGRDKLTFFTSPSINSFSDWVEQLIAESTGKEGRGILPVAGEALGAASVYGADRFFVAIELPGEPLDTHALEKAGHPIIHLSLENTFNLGGLIFLWEFIAAVAGHGLGIQPFDQPNVESAKVLAREMVAAYQHEGKLPIGKTNEATAQILEEFLMNARVDDYISIQAYVTPNQGTSIALDKLRQKLRDKHKLATTVGYGPRFLHSTGQLHKGDGGNGLFIQIISKTGKDVDIPNQAGQDGSDISFGVLKQAQALGDAKALRDAGRRVLSLSVEANPTPQINKMVKALS